MICLISPSKDLDFKNSAPFISLQTPRLWSHSLEILSVMKTKKPKALMKMMDISEKLAIENVERFQNMELECLTSNSKPAIYSFSGDVYRGLGAMSMNQNEIEYCKNHLRILSGLYGLLRPMDLIQAYRLEMGRRVTIKKSKNLYNFWGDKITKLLIEDINESKSKYLINLSSKEYFESIQTSLIPVPIIHIQFREMRNGKLNFLSYNAKRARGLVIQYMAKNNVQELVELQKFNLENYQFDIQLSQNNEIYFVR